MLRINTDGTIPTDNPFLSQTTGVNPAIWARGFRNPFTFAFQPGTGRLHINDVGENTWEEVNLGAAGANYGWPRRRGRNPPGQAGVTYPVHAYENAGSNCAIVGAAFYNPRPRTFPSTYVGRYFFGDFCGGFIRTLSPPAYTQSSRLRDRRRLPRGSGRRPATDRLYYLSRGAGGSLFRVRFTNNAAPQITQHPQSRTVAVGQSVTFQVAASGAAPLEYQWLRNGVEILGATSPSFTIGSAALTDDGDTFAAVVSNEFGTGQSNGALLTVTTNTPPDPASRARRTAPSTAAARPSPSPAPPTTPKTACCRPAPSPGRWTSTTTTTPTPSWRRPAGSPPGRSRSPPAGRRRPTSSTG